MSVYSLPISVYKLEEAAERMQRRFEKAETPEEFARISEEVSRRVAILAPIADILQRYMIIAELAHREVEQYNKGQAQAAASEPAPHEPAA